MERAWCEPTFMERLHIILCAISSFKKLNATKLKAYCLDTAKLNVEKYDWYYMPQSLHKVLFHAHQVVIEKDMPLGILSEEDVMLKYYRILVNIFGFI